MGSLREAKGCLLRNADLGGVFLGGLTLPEAPLSPGR